MKVVKMVVLKDLRRAAMKAASMVELTAFLVFGMLVSTTVALKVDRLVYEKVAMKGFAAVDQRAAMKVVWKAFVEAETKVVRMDSLMG